MKLKALNAIILAGGKSSRMGRDKGLVKLEGRAMVEHVIEAVKPLVKNILLISSNKEYQHFDCALYSDLMPGKGPMGGLLTGLHYSDVAANLVLSCDAPFVRQDQLERLIKTYSAEQALISEYKGVHYPLIGIYNKSILPILNEFIEKEELKLGHFLNNIFSRKIVFEKESEELNIAFSNLNTPEDIKNLTFIHHDI